MTYFVEGETPIAAMYRQFDGYIDCHGKALASFLAGKHLVNGFGPDDEVVAFNGMGDLAVRTIVAIKADGTNPPMGMVNGKYQPTGPAPAPQDAIGGYYLCDPHTGQEEEYNYYVSIVEATPDEHLGGGRHQLGSPGEIQITVRAYEKEIFRGTPAELLAFKEEEED